MAVPRGTFSPEILPVGWFDETADVSGWFDAGNLDAPPAGAQTYTIGNNTGNSFSGTEDTSIYETSPTNNFGGSVNLEVVAFGAGDSNHTLIKFDITPLSAGNVSATSLELWLNSAGGAAETVNIRRLLVPWDEAQATWNNRVTGTAWGTAGAQGDAVDRVATVSGTLTRGTITGQYYVSSDLSADLTFWRANPSQNYGWVLEIDSAPAGNFGIFTSSEGTDGNRPVLRTTIGAAAGSHDLSGALNSPSSALAASFARTRLHDLVGALASQAASLSGSFARSRVHDLTGSLQSQASTLSGSLARSRIHDLSGSLLSQDSALSATLTRTPPGKSLTAALQAQDAALSGAFARSRAHDLTGSLLSGASSLSGAFTRTGTHALTGALQSQAASLSAALLRTPPGKNLNAALSSQAAALSGAFARSRIHNLSGGLLSQASQVSATFTRSRTHDLTADIDSGSAALSAALVRTPPGPVTHNLSGALQSGEAAVFAQFARQGDGSEVTGGGIADWVSTELRRRAVQAAVQRKAKKATLEEQAPKLIREAREFESEAKQEAKKRARVERDSMARVEYEAQLSNILRQQLLANRLDAEKRLLANIEEKHLQALYAEFVEETERMAVQIIVSAQRAAWLIALSE